MSSARSDALYSIWALAWESHALLTEPRHFLDANIYHPALHALLYGPTALGALVIFGPTFVLTRDPVVAGNVLFIGGTSLTAWTTSLVARRWTGTSAAGLVAGCAYLSVPWVLWEWAPTVPHYAALFCLPLIFELVARDSLRPRDTVWLGLLIALQGSVELVYIAPAIFIPLGVIAISRICRRRTRTNGLALSGAMVAAFLLLLPLLLASAEILRANPHLGLQSAWAYHPGDPEQKIDLLKLPWGLFGWWRVPMNRYAAPSPMALPPAAFALILLGGASFLMHRRQALPTAAPWRHAFIWATAGTLLALPPSASWYDTPITLPHAWLYVHVALIHVLRVPMRLGVVALIGFSLATGVAFAELAGRLREQLGSSTAKVASSALSLALGAIFLAQSWTGLGYPSGFTTKAQPFSYPVMTRPFATPFSSELRRGHGPLLEIGAAMFLPPMLRPQLEAVTMFRSIGHWRPLINGYSSYWPTTYPQAMKLAARLPNDERALAALQRLTGVELILVWPDELPTEQRNAWWARAEAADSIPLELVAEDDQVLLFRVRSKPQPAL
jgi:hypothetical protein